MHSEGLAVNLPQVQDGEVEAIICPCAGPKTPCAGKSLPPALLKQVCQCCVKPLHCRVNN